MMKLWKWLVWSGLLLAALGMFLWALTGYWMGEGRKAKADGKNEFAIVLGAKVNGEVPSLSLRYRLDAALAYGEAQPHVKFILSGGQGPDEAITEAEAMRRYMVEHGIPEDRLILESTSTSTYENIRNSKELLPEGITAVTLITSDYHVSRARKIATNLGLTTDAVAAETPQVVKAKLKARERLALLKTFLTGK
ncbi:YdcF family protein [Sporosarcina sp. 179-K 3D1 HS]|uniref:YdcF family protein n=1 Tax=Sporosarcina sp. 179-K 3D1 HS TaxID=3232169 RepID=UPI0039A348C0